MATEKELSSTEKLLDVIRKGTNQPGADARAADDPLGSVEQHIPGPGNRSLSFGAKAVVGVEILADGLRTVKMAKTGGSWRAEQVLTTTTDALGPLDSPAFISFLRHSLQRIDGIKKAHVWTMIANESGEIWQINVPSVKKDIHNAVFWTAKKEKHFDESTTAFDYRVMGETTDGGAKKLAVEVLTAPREELDLLKKVFAKAGFPLEGITLPSFALQNLFTSRRINAGPDAFAVLSIGQNSSAIDIHQEDRMLLSRVIKTGLDSMVEAILDHREIGAVPGSQRPATRDQMQALDSIARLENSSAKTAGARDFETAEETFTMISPAIERLARQVERTIDHSSNVLGHPIPTRLYLSGRLASAPGIIDFFHDQLGLTAVVLDPLHPAMPHVSPGVGSLSLAERVFLSPATGLALSSNRITPNFLCTARDREKQKVVKRNGALVGTGLLALALVAGVFLFHAQQELARARDQTTRLQQKINSLSPPLTSSRISRMSADYLERTEVLRKYAQKFVPVAVLSELAAIASPHIRLLSVRLEMDRPDAKQARFLVLEGFVKGEDISFETHLSSYLFHIRKSPLFADTTIQNSSTVNFESEGQVLRFVININLKQVTHERT